MREGGAVGHSIPLTVVLLLLVAFLLAVNVPAGLVSLSGERTTTDLRSATIAPSGEAGSTAVNFTTGTVPLGAPGAEPVAVVTDTATGRVYVEDSPGVIIEIDEQTGQRIDTLTIGNGSIGANAPASLGLDEVSQQLWAIGPGPLGVSEVDLAANAVIRSSQLPGPCGAVLGLALAPAQASVWVACAQGVYALSTVNGSLVYAYPSSFGPIYPSGVIVYNPARSQIVVAGEISPSDGGNGLAIFDPTNLSFAGELSLGGCCGNIDPTGAGLVNAATDTLVLTATSGRSTWGLALLNASSYANSTFSFLPIAGHPVGLAEGIGSPATVYLALYGARSVGAFDLQTRQLGTSVATNGEVAAVATDPTTSLTFAADVDTAQLLVLEAPALSVRSVLAIGGGPGAIAYDAAAGTLWVGNANNITVVSGHSRRVVETLPVDFGPSAIAINATTGRAYVATYDNANVTVYNATSYARLTTFPVDPGPVAILQVPNGQIYVACQSAYYGRVDAVSASPGGNYSVVARLTVGNTPSSLTYDPATGRILVANPFTDNLSVIAPSAPPSVVATVPLPGFNPWALAYDTRSGELFLSDANLVYDASTGKESSQVDALSAGNYTLLGSVTVDPATYGIVYDPLVDFVFVASYVFNTVDVIDPSSLSWTATVPVGLSPFPALFDPQTGEVYVGNSFSANLTYISTPAPVYPIEFTEQGLTNGSWAVTLAGSTLTAAAGSPITFFVANGTFAFRAQATNESADPASGTLTIAGGPVAQTISFRPSSMGRSGGGAWWEGATAYYLVLDLGLAVTIAAVVSLILWKRRGRRPRPLPPAPAAAAVTADEPGAFEPPAR